MRKLLSLSIILLLTVVLFNGCQDRSDISAPTPSTGTADFTRFVTIGNSITAGYQSGALYESAQMYSYGNQIAKLAGTSFAYPNYSDPGTGGRIEAKSVYPSFVSYNNPLKGTPTNSTYPLVYNNLGVPGAFLYDFLNAYDSLSCFTSVMGGPKNPMFNLVLRNQGSAKMTQFQAAKALSPTFMVFWLGNNDILGYASTGGTTPFTPVANFSVLYNQALDSLKTLGKPVVVGNIPDVSVIPFLSTVGLQLYSAGMKVVWGIRGGTLDTIPMNVLTNYLTLNASALIPQGFGSTKAMPLPNSVILDSLEIIAAKATVASYNGIIQAAATRVNFGYADINKTLTEINAKNFTGGYLVDGLTITTMYVTGGIFSLDGVHPTNLGQALIANEFISVMNSKYGAKLSRINLASVPPSLILTGSSPLKSPSITGPLNINFNYLSF